MTINNLLERVYIWPSVGHQARTPREDNIKVAESLGHNLHVGSCVAALPITSCREISAPLSRRALRRRLSNALTGNPTQPNGAHPGNPFLPVTTTCYYSSLFPKSLSYVKVESKLLNTVFMFPKKCKLKTSEDQVRME